MAILEYSFFEKEILAFYRERGRKYLPWRKKSITLYEVWVSEIMLQQTQVDRVIDFYVQFLRRFPTIQTLAQVSWEEFLPYYQGLGYYNRGRNMLRTAKIVEDQYGGVFPEDIKLLELLPGIGTYTARAIVSFGNNANYLAWDTNFSRVFGRFFHGSKDIKINPSFFEGKIETDKRDFNGAIMDFGSLMCTKSPECVVCPLREKCRYFREKGSSEMIGNQSGESFPSREARVWVFLHDNHKVYYSVSKNAFRPFQLPKTSNAREGIKSYFLKRYNLTVSVRPPHKKIFIGGKPTMFVNAQILLGTYDFFVYTKQEMRQFLTKRG